MGTPLLNVFRMQWFSQIMGWIFTASFSRYYIPFFTRLYGIQMDTYIVPPGGFQSLNHFFIRRTKPDFRTFPVDIAKLGSPIDGCIEIFQWISANSMTQVKWYSAQLRGIFWPEIEHFEWGDLCFCRLRFADYHRYHFVDDAEIMSSVSRAWPLCSVDNNVLDTGLWIQNKSHLTSMKTSNFGDILWIEIGATNVGSITNYHEPQSHVIRGEEKGYFSLGWSAVLILFKKSTIEWSSSLLQKSSKKEEYEVITGDVIGQKKIVS